MLIVSVKSFSQHGRITFLKAQIKNSFGDEIRPESRRPYFKIQ